MAAHKGSSLSNIFLLLTLNLLIKPFWLLGIDRNVQLAIGLESYGLYAALYNLSFWPLVLLDPGIHTYINTTVARHTHLLTKFNAGLLPFKLAISIAYFILGMLLGWIIGYRDAALHILSLILVNQVLISFVLYFRASLAGLHQFRTDSYLSVIDRAIAIIICGSLLMSFAGGHFRIEYYLYGQMIAYFLTVIVAAGLVFRETVVFRMRWNPAFLRIILRKSLPFALLGILMTLYTRTDAIMIDRLLPESIANLETGRYASAYRLLDAVNIIAYLFATILLPVYARLIERRQSPGSVSSAMARLLGVPAWILVLICFFFARPIMSLMYGAESDNYLATLFGSLMITFLSFCIIYIYGSLLTANRSVSFLNWTSGLGFVANILLNLYFIPRYHAMGGVISTLITQFSVSLLQMYRAHTIFELKVPLRAWARAIMFGAISIALFFSGSVYLQWDWYYILGLVSVLSLIFAVALRMLTYGQIKVIFNSQETEI